MVRKLKKSLNKPVWLSSGIFLIAVIFVWVLVWQHKHNSSANTIPSTSPSAALNATSNQSSNNSSQDTVPTKSTSSALPSGSSAPLTLDAAQTLVSNHHPTNSTPDEQSTCNTTPGASCYIQFTQGNITKSLASKVADGNGAVIWNWDISSAGLSSGSWQITAVATLNGQSKTATDPTALEIE